MKDLTDQSLKFDINLSDHVEVLMNMIKARTNLQYDAMRLLFGRRFYTHFFVFYVVGLLQFITRFLEKQLEKNKKLDEYNIQAESTIYLVGRLHGGNR